MIYEERPENPVLFFSKDEYGSANRYPSEKKIRRLHRQIFYLWEFIGQEGLWNEAKDYLDDNIEEPIPYEW